MLKKLLTALSFGIAASTGGAAETHLHAPYANPASNAIYNLLFCDNPALFLPKTGEQPTHWQVTLGSANIPALESLASDESQEGRVRYLAFSKLRALGHVVATKILLGVIVEVPLAGGLDALAAFSEGGVRYLNQSGKLVVIEGVPQFLPSVKRLFEVSQPVVQRIGPWTKPRLAPPKQGNVRLTFLVSDGLYFGEGQMAVMQREPMAGPVIEQATELLQAVVATGSK